jgi:hypothetical protein
MSKAARWEPNLEVLKDIRKPVEVDDVVYEDLSKNGVKGHRDHRHNKRDQEKKDKKWSDDSWN